MTKKFQMEEKGRDDTSNESRLWKDFLWILIGILGLKILKKVVKNIQVMMNDNENKLKIHI